MLEFKLLWREIFGVLHIVVDEVAICRVPLYKNNVSHDETKFIYCLGCMEKYLDAGLQFKAIWANKQAQVTQSDYASLNEPSLSAKIVEQITLTSESQSTIVNLGEWVEQRKQKSTTQVTSSSFVAQEQQDATDGLNHTEQSPTKKVY